MRIDGRLVGLANAISDGHLDVYFPHMLVHPEYHRRGIGRLIMRAPLARYSGFHQLMLTADGDAVRFYQTEQFIIRALRPDRALSVSLVAEEAGRIVGHVALSCVSISDGAGGW